MEKEEKLQVEHFEKIVFQLSGLLHATVDLMEPAKFDVGNITLPQGKILFLLLNYYPEGMMLKDIAKSLKITAGFASPTVEALVQLGLVTRKQKEGDRRAVEFRASEKARKLMDEKEKAVRKLFKKLISGCEKEEVEVFEKVLFNVYKNLKEFNNCLQEE